jgi:hypothetical protein
MSIPEPAAQTDAERIIQLQEETISTLSSLVEAINGLGANQQWIVDNVKGIFEMFGSPAFMSNMMGAFNGGFAADLAAADASGTADFSDINDG